MHRARPTPLLSRRGLGNKSEKVQDLGHGYRRTNRLKINTRHVGNLHNARCLPGRTEKRNPYFLIDGNNPGLAVNH